MIIQGMFIRTDEIISARFDEITEKFYVALSNGTVWTFSGLTKRITNRIVRDLEANNA